MNLNVEVILENRSSNQVQATKGPLNIDFKGITQKIFLDDVDGNGPMRQAIEAMPRR